MCVHVCVCVCARARARAFMSEAPVCEQVGGKWLKDSFTVGAIMCMVALYANTIITAEVALQYFIEERFFPSARLPPAYTKRGPWVSAPSVALAVFLSLVCVCVCVCVCVSDSVCLVACVLSLSHGVLKSPSVGFCVTRTEVQRRCTY